jgi:serine protein kinase
MGKFVNGNDAVFGLDIPLMRLVNVFKSAAYGYGTEKRVLLLHGPVGSSKSTIARLLKRGMEQYSAPPRARSTPGVAPARRAEARGRRRQHLPLPDERGAAAAHPRGVAQPGLRAARLRRTSRTRCRSAATSTPACRLIFRELMEHYNGDWSKVMKHVAVKRLVLSEKDRVGIGTFQPKDEKNQDSTELTGDINYRKIAEFGSDSDPRAFNFDGEFNVANRGIIEFIEVLKLDVAFLYDLLARRKSTRSSPRSSRRPTSTRSSSATPTRPSTRSS